MPQDRMDAGDSEQQSHAKRRKLEESSGLLATVYNVITSCLHVIFLACPGHGKTEWGAHLVGRFATCVDSMFRVNAKDILSMTYTNQAARTFKHRVKQLYAIQTEACTIHSWCSRFNAHVNSLNPNVPAVTSLCTMVRDVLIRQRNDKAEFRDILHNNMHKYKVIIVDEAQDMSDDQFRLLQVLASEWRARVILIGDACQAIYGFQGANPKHFCDFADSDWVKTTRGDCMTLTGKENRRCSPPIVAAANSGLSRLELPPSLRMQMESEPKRSDEVPRALLDTYGQYRNPVVSCFHKETDQVQTIVAKVKDLVDRGVPPNKIAILHAYNRGLMPFAVALLDEGIPVNHNGHGVQDNAVNVYTYHSSKGGTWEAIFIVDAHDEDYRPEEVEEVKRLFHVVLTRARLGVSISYVRDGFYGVNRVLTRCITKEDVERLYDQPPPSKVYAKVECWRDTGKTREDYKRPKATLLEAVETQIAALPFDPCADLVQSMIDVSRDMRPASECLMQREELIGEDAPSPTTNATGLTEREEAMYERADSTAGLATRSPERLWEIGLADYFNDCITEYARYDLHSAIVACGYAPQDSPKFAGNACNLLLVPMLGAKHRTALENESSPDDIRKAAEKMLAKRRTEIANFYFKQDVARYNTVKQQCGAVATYRAHEKIWDGILMRQVTPKEVARKQVTKKCMGALVDLLDNTLHDDHDKLASIMVCMLATSDIGFAAYCKSDLPVETIAREDAECARVVQVVKRVTSFLCNRMNLHGDAGAAATLSTPTTAVKVEVDGVTYPSLFDFTKANVHVTLLCDDQARGTIPVHLLLAAIMSTGDREDTAEYLFVNLSTGQIHSFTATRKQRLDCMAAYRSTVSLSAE